MCAVREEKREKITFPNFISQYFACCVIVVVVAVVGLQRYVLCIHKNDFCCVDLQWWILQTHHEHNDDGPAVVVYSVRKRFSPIHTIHTYMYITCMCGLFIQLDRVDIAIGIPTEKRNAPGFVCV